MTPGRGAWGGELSRRDPLGWRRVVLKKNGSRPRDEGREDPCAPEVGDDSLLDLIADAKGLDQPEVLVLAVGGLDGAQEQAALYDTAYTRIYGPFQGNIL